jgi:chromosome segregation ATPase
MNKLHHGQLNCSKKGLLECLKRFLKKLSKRKVDFDEVSNDLFEPPCKRSNLFSTEAPRNVVEEACSESESEALNEMPACVNESCKHEKMLLSRELAKTKENLKGRRKKVNALTENVKQLKRKLERRDQRENNNLQHLAKKIKVLKSHETDMMKQAKTNSSNMKQLEKQLKDQNSKFESMKAEMQSLKSKLNDIEDDNHVKSEEMVKLEASVA